MTSATARWMQSVSRQLAANARSNLLSEERHAGIVVSGEFLSALNRFASAPPAEHVVAELSSHAAEQFRAYVLAINPYIEFDAGDRAELEGMYRESARRVISGTPPERVLAEHHYPALRRWTERKYPPSARRALRSRPTLGSVAYEHYSAQLQLQVLNLTPADIRVPVIDLGCGAEAALVRHLRELGIEAFGIDRALPESSEYLFSMSWFDLPLENLNAALLLSHLAFSSHLLYQYTTGGPECDRYVERYHAILDALGPGGVFAYAPALPFLEDSLPGKRFAVERRIVAAGFEAAQITRLAQRR